MRTDLISFVESKDWKQLKYDDIYVSNFLFLYKNATTMFKWNIQYSDPNISVEIEKRLLETGICGIVDGGGKNFIKAVYASEFGNTEYYDVYKSFTVHTSEPLPNRRNSFDIGKNGVLVRNNSIKAPTMFLVKKYAELLTHCDLSIRNVTINSREPNKFPTVISNKQKEIVEDYRRQLIRGEYSAIVDNGLITMAWQDAPKNNTGNLLTSLYDVRKKILNDFFNLLGVKTGVEKRGNVISEEVTSNDESLYNNIEDELICRRKACEEIHEVLGIMASVDYVGNSREEVV